MLIYGFFQWWVTSGWSQQVQRAVHFPGNLVESFGLDMLLRTLFSPWKRIVSINRRDQALGDKLRNLLDNFVSRMVGFFVRMLVLLGLGFVFVVGLAIHLALALVWPLLTLVPIGLIGVGFWV